MSDEATIRNDRADKAATRRVTTVLVGDIVGYANMMSIDETNTHARVIYVQDQVVEPAINQHGGHMVKMTGDSFLAVFENAVEAVRCALNVQQRMDEENRDLQKSNWIRFRMGLDYNSVIVERHDIYGDGINIAARLQQIAEPGSIYISCGLYEQVHQKLVCRYQPLGEKKLKNIVNPVTTYRVVPLAAAISRERFKKSGMALFGYAAATVALLAAGAGYQWWQAHQSPEQERQAQLAALIPPPPPSVPKASPPVPPPVSGPKRVEPPQQRDEVRPPQLQQEPVRPPPVRPPQAQEPSQTNIESVPPPPPRQEPVRPVVQQPPPVQPPQEATRPVVQPPPPVATPAPPQTPKPVGNVVLRPPNQQATMGPEMVTIPAGSFMMGSTEDSSEQPVHRVTVSSFEMAKYPVTVGEWRACVQAAACELKPKGNDQAPMTNVSYTDAMQYVSWLSQRAGRPYRLPSEAEWEYAARGGTTTRYWWGNNMNTGVAVCRGCGSEGQPQRVGLNTLNPFGLEINGGVMEWVSDCWFPTYHLAPNDASARSKPNCSEHVLRGSAWNTDANYARSSARNFYDDAVRYPTHGLRVALSK